MDLNLEFGGLAGCVGDGFLQTLQLGVVADPLGVDDVADGFVAALDVFGFGHLLLDTLNGRR